uniref:Uncharacterized protein n=1 Tax=Candidatus Kentrum sp. SD TaxID=2126332 RepID=A0A451BHR6_9GAMM|nr:MAG: hypothetical protein BECKSD772F_GA0070984_100248 [Candidatus Kentron sp. SD]VFK39216.1 MAG: hypothetical protein BECKSD772E_GA0070983_100246 [Candidatus Kentron sp. SD]VFK77833.1 MAG: hypothetical protein BECKSD772D_GA0070982_100247 [Candidatus Kentron sp. SD]
MTSQRHIIKRQVLELRATGEQEGRQLSNEFAHLYRRRILPLIDRCCARLGDPDRTHRIESLEMDLGLVDPAHFEADVMDRINARLPPLLASHIGQSERQEDRRQPSDGRSPMRGEGESADPSHPGRDRTETDAGLELLDLFARAGSLPWWADASRSERLDETLESLLRQAPNRLRALVRRLAKSPRPLRRIVNHYADDRLSALFKLVAPALARALSDPLRTIPRRIGDPVGDPRRRNTLLPAQSPITIRNRVWSEALRLASVSGPHHRSPSAFLRDLLPRVAASAGIDRATLASAMARSAPANERELWEKAVPEPRRQGEKTEDPGIRKTSGEDLAGQGHETDPGYSDEEQCYVGNAGLAILWPFLSHFFHHLGLARERRFKDEAARQRAVGLLQYLVNEDTSSPPEYLLPVNKVLCGMAPDDLFAFDPPVLESEAEECRNLLQAVIAQAPILKDMSVSAFRNAFLLREGILTARDGAWLLRVERKTHDVVLDRFPWRLEWIALPWMETALRVEW